jgi:hypothetical protein
MFLTVPKHSDSVMRTLTTKHTTISHFRFYFSLFLIQVSEHIKNLDKKQNTRFLGPFGYGGVRVVYGGSQSWFVFCQKHRETQHLTFLDFGNGRLYSTHKLLSA